MGYQQKVYEVKNIFQELLTNMDKFTLESYRIESISRSPKVLFQANVTKPHPNIP